MSAAARPQHQGSAAPAAGAQAAQETPSAEERDAQAVARLAAQLAAVCSRPWTLMEVCGGQTHAIVRWGLDQLLPAGLRLIHGPGCPVCVTPAGTVEQALALARRPEVILCSYGDMLRVPGLGRDDLLAVRARGGDVRLLTSPLQALAIARAHPDRQVVVLAVGFETTAPATALLARQALALGVANLSLLNAHVRVAPAMEAIVADPANRVQAFLAAGHVCAVVGTAELEALVARRRLPVVVSGFAPVELMAALLACVRQLEAGEARLQNAYGAVVRSRGNPRARELLAEVFEPCDQPWRGLGLMAGGGLALRGPYAALEARRRFALPLAAAGTEAWQGSGSPAAGSCTDGRCHTPATWWSAPARQGQAAGREPAADQCIAGAILRGQALPPQCPAFAGTCTPDHPLGAPMVSSEGACAAYWRYRR